MDIGVNIRHPRHALGHEGGGVRRPLLLLFAVLPFIAACHDYEAQHDADGGDRAPAQQTGLGQEAATQQTDGQPADQQQRPLTPSENFTKNLVAVFSNAIQNALPSPGGKMPHGDPQYVLFENLPRPDVASFGLTCNAADLVGRWKWDNANVWLPGSAHDDDAWVEVTPSRITFVVNVKNHLMEEAENGLWAGMEHLRPPRTPIAGFDPPANRTKQRGPVPIVAFDYTLRQTDLCAWELSFQEQVENRQGVGTVQQTCTLAVEYAALGTGTLTDRDDFLWERLNFYDCFPRAEAAQARLDQLGLTLSQGHNGDGFERQHWLQMWSRRRQASWWNQ